MKLLYFAWLRARIGCAEEEIPLPPQVDNVAGLLDWLRERSGQHAEALRDLRLVRVAVNQEYVGFSYPVREDDEVALFPPVTGG
jgi:sulfur-carrier protein